MSIKVETLNARNKFDEMSLMFYDSNLIKWGRQDFINECGDGLLFLKKTLDWNSNEITQSLKPKLLA